MTPLNGYVVLKKALKESWSVVLIEKKDTELTRFEIVHPWTSWLSVWDIVLTNFYLVEEIDWQFLCKERNLVAKVS